MQSDFYKNYMRSDAWAQKKQQRMQIDDYSCVMCGRSKDHCRTLQVHHISYRRLGNEDVLEDLCTLCGSCHRKIHNYYGRKRSNNYGK